MFWAIQLLIHTSPTQGKLGAIVGRYANRINQAQAVIDGVSYTLDANNGAHCLHGGRENIGAAGL